MCIARAHDDVTVRQVSLPGVTDKDLAYDRISGHWDRVIANYDTRRRIEVLVDEFLAKIRALLEEPLSLAL